MTKQTQYVLMQLIGYAAASKGYSVKSLAEEMGMTKKEWMEVRNHVFLKKTDHEELDEYFKCDPIF